MEIIYKYNLEILGRQEIVLPINHEILCVQLQNGEIKIWVKHNTSFNESHFIFYIYGTGEVLRDIEHQKYIGTVQLDNGLVLHIFKQL